MVQDVLSPWPFLSHCWDSRGPAVPPGRGLQGERSSGATPPLCCHRTKVKPEFCSPTTSHSPSQLSRAHAPPAPALSPTPRSRLPRGPHKALGSPAAESHRCHSLGPCALPRARCAFPVRSTAAVAEGGSRSHQRFPRRRWRVAPGGLLLQARESPARRGRCDCQPAGAPWRGGSGGHPELSQRQALGSDI